MPCYVYRTGVPATEIHTCAGIDPIVMATHGRGGVARLMMGGVADKEWTVERSVSPDAAAARRRGRAPRVTQRGLPAWGVAVCG